MDKKIEEIKIEKLDYEEVKKIIQELKLNGTYNNYKEMISDDYEEHKIVYKLDEDDMIALAYKNNTTPFKLKEFYNWQEMNFLIEEEEYGYE